MASLGSLPTELQHNIFSYLIRPLSHLPVDGMPRTPALHEYILIRSNTNSRGGKSNLSNHPFYNLAATSRTLRGTVEAFCHSLLVQYEGVMGSKADKKDYVDWSQQVEKRGRSTGNKCERKVWVKFFNQRCIFCGKNSSRKAVFNLLMWCCKRCDVKHYGTRISKTAAQSAHKVKEIHWATPKLVFPDSDLKPLSVAISNISACAGATFLLEAEVKERAQYIKEHDPKGKLTRAAVKKQDAEKKAEYLARGLDVIGKGDGQGTKDNPFDLDTDGLHDLEDAEDLLLITSMLVVHKQVSRLADQN
ncbi:hypothetical protein EJ08DRAFT_657792 [Tothia fuscella]|uniref:Uncharacterized protein n=1 Tax=Tothia fuscella TaxID=1048955 RepID=A0A9P4NYJ2_9PEZI|nr:hypothetical protein EJ08DRAFT_657792 [Tothia fuscella]